MATKLRHQELTLRGRVLLLLALLATTAAWFSDDANARVAAALLAAPVFVDFVCKQRGLDRLQVRVEPRRTVAGAPFCEQLQLHSEARRALRELIVFEPRTLRDGGALVEHLRPGHSAIVALTCRSPVRSHVLQRVFCVTSTWPLGLLRVRAELGVDSEIVTEPARVTLAAAVLRSVLEHDPAPREVRSLAGPEFHSLREYRHGEDARSVHALRSAAFGTLVRRVTQGRLPHEVGVVLDLRRPPDRPLVLGNRRFEWSLGAVASLVELLRAEDILVQVLVLGERTVHTPVGSPAQAMDLFTFLAEAAPSPFRTLEPGTLAALRECDRGYWVPAGGFLGQDELGSLPGGTTVLGGEDE